MPLRIAMTATDRRGLEHGLDDDALERLVGRWLHDQAGPGPPRLSCRQAQALDTGRDR